MFKLHLPPLTSVLVWFFPIVLSGCAGVMSPHYAPSKIDVPDGFHTYTYQWFSHLLDVKNDDDLTYVGQYVNGIPKGPGKMTGVKRQRGSCSVCEPAGTYPQDSCEGEFGVDAPAGSGWVATHSWDNEGKFRQVLAKGVVRTPEGKPYFTGYFTSTLPSAKGCVPLENSVGRYESPQGWAMTSTLNSSLQPTTSTLLRPRSGRCSIIGPDGITMESERCFVNEGNIDPGFKSRLGIEIPAKSKVDEVFGLISGPVKLTLPDGAVITGVANKGNLFGAAKLLPKDGGDPQLVWFNGGRKPGKLRHLAPEVIARKGKICGGPNNYYLVNGTCQGGTWDGLVSAYTLDGLTHIEGRFRRGQATGYVVYSTLADGRSFKGQMVRQNSGFAYTSARISQEEQVVYDGEIRDFKPHGQGTCWYEGKPERCEHLDGERVDAIYKTRLENERLRLALEAQRRQQQREAAERAEAQRQQQLAQQQSATEESGGFQWGKLAAMGTGALIGGLDKLPVDAQAKIIAGMAADSTAGTSGMGNTQRAAAGVSAAAGSTTNGGSSSGSSSVTGSAVTQGGDEAARNRAIGQRCSASTQSIKPWNNPQLDTMCQLASFDKCLVDSGITAYEGERQQVCSSLLDTLKPIGGNLSSCSACH